MIYINKFTSNSFPPKFTSNLSLSILSRIFISNFSTRYQCSAPSLDRSERRESEERSFEYCTITMFPLSDSERQIQRETRAPSLNETARESRKPSARGSDVARRPEFVEPGSICRPTLVRRIGIPAYRTTRGNKLSFASVARQRRVYCTIACGRYYPRTCATCTRDEIAAPPRARRN